MTRHLPFILIALCSVHFALSQTPAFSFRHYTTENGFPSRVVKQVVQDKYGFLWFSSEHTLIRYDGSAFQLYRHDDHDSTSLPESGYLDLYTGANGEFIIGCDKGIYHFDFDNDDFKLLAATSTMKSNSSGTPFTKDHDVWFATQDKVLHKVDLQTGRLTNFATCKSFIASAFIDSRNNVWVGTHEGLYKFDPAQNKYELWWSDTLHKQYGASIADHIIEDEKNNIWFSGYNSGIYKMDVPSRKISFYDFKPLHWVSSSFYSISHIINAEIDGHPYIMTDSNDGLVLLDKTSEKLSLIKRNPADPTSLLTDNLFDVFQDNTGTVWLASYKGVSKLERKISWLKTLPLSVANKFTAVAQENSSNTVWIGTDSVSVFRYDFITNKVLKQIELKNKQGKHLGVLELFIDKADRLWIGTNEGAFVYDINSAAMLMTNETNAGRDLFAGSEVGSNFTEDAQGNIWVGTANGVSIYNAQLQFIKNLKEIKTDPASLKGSHVFAMHPANDHQVWIATRLLNLYDSRTGSFDTGFAKKGIQTAPRFVYDITDDNKGNTVFTNTGRIYLQAKTTDSFSAPGFSKYISDVLLATVVDRSGQFWTASVGGGLLKTDLHSNNITYINSRKGLLGNNVNKCVQSSPGAPIFLVMAEGIQYFYPDSLRTDSAAAPIVISNIRIMEEHLKADYNRFADSSLGISYRQNVLSFEYSMLDYSYSDDITYQYKLDGFDEKWINAGKRNIVTYTNLDAGNYTFHVRAKNYEGYESGKEAILKFHVIPPFWKTWWFTALLILAGCGLLFGWIWSLQQKLRSQKILNRFATSLYGQNTIEEIFWDVARDSVTLLGFIDCVVYFVDDKKNALVQKAAYGPKTEVPYEISNPIEIPLGKGIVGTVAVSGKAERIGNTRKDERYIVDDEHRLSEIAVPVIVDEKVFGVIDSEHPDKNFYTRWHLRMLQEMASICAAKISLQVIQDRIRSKIARDLHDDMGSTLSSINIISKMALENAKAEEVSDHLEKIRENSGNMLDSMSDIVWAINPGNDTLDKVILRMKEFAGDILDPLNIRYEFMQDGDFKHVKLDLNKRKDFYLVFKEAINNAAKYSQCKRIDVLLFKDHSTIEMQIIDDGAGFDTGTIKYGNGLNNMHERALQMHGLLQVSSTQGEGTTIKLRIRSHD